MLREIVGRAHGVALGVRQLEKEKKGT